MPADAAAQFTALCYAAAAIMLIVSALVFAAANRLHRVDAGDGSRLVRMPGTTKRALATAAPYFTAAALLAVLPLALPIVIEPFRGSAQ